MSSPPRNIIGWVKLLKTKSLLSSDSVNELSDSSDESPQLLRPMLHHKSRSTNNVNRVRLNSNSDSGLNPSTIRQHRDSFLLNNPLVDKNSQYFGLPLEESIHKGCAKISIFTDENSDEVLQYGKIPVVVAKCGVFLKSNGLNVEGIFRVGGSSKRLKDLQLLFNTPPDFGKKLDWDGYTVHDAASILRRFLNSLPEPLIPLDLYEEFRLPLRSRPRVINYMKYRASPRRSSPDPSDPNDANTDHHARLPKTEVHPASLSPPPHSPSALGNNSGNIPDVHDTAHESGQANNIIPTTPKELPLPSPLLTPAHDDVATTPIILVGEKGAEKAVEKAEKKTKNYRKLTKDVHDAIGEYSALLDKLPPYSKQLLFYILDLLAMVQNHSTVNLMSARNLAAIFQPLILSHPNHDLNPVEYALSSYVVEFLIQYAYKLLPNHEHIKTNNGTLVPGFKRQHSKSLSSTRDEVVGGHNQLRPVVDSDFGESASDSER